MNLWKRFSEIGLHDGTQPYCVRSIVLANRVAFVLFILTSLLVSVLVAIDGYNIATLRIAGSLLFYVSTPLLNHYRKYDLSRVIISTVVPLYILYLIGVNPNNDQVLVYSGSYFPPRILTIATCIIPFLVFNTFFEKSLLIVTSFVGFVCAIGYDFLLAAMGKEVDVYQRTDLFIYYNLIFFLQFATLTISSFMLKRSVDRTDEANRYLIKEKEATNKLLLDKNVSLEELNKEIETQNEEMKLQAEELNASHEKTEESSRIIEQQRNELALYNKQLEQLVVAKNQELVNTNEELIKHNSELRQFSFTISHNLRAPVARLLGLTYLLDGYEKDLPESLREYIGLIQKSTNELDVVIKDLNKIIDIRNEIYRIKERVLLQGEWEKVLSIVQPNIHFDAQIDTNFEEAPELFTIRPIIHNAFYNLLSNAIKYRSPQRTLQVKVQTTISNQNLIIAFTDNGLGIDLTKFGKSIFGLYKRFHMHVEGKGLGLYLVKTQLESIGGSLALQSVVNQGSTFTLSFPISTGLHEQIFFENDCAVISYNAVQNNCCLVWRKQVDSKEYRAVYSKVVEMLSIYNTPAWLSDSRALIQVNEEDLEWMFGTILTQARKNGLERIALVLNESLLPPAYVAYIKERTEKIGLMLKIVSSITKGDQWLAENTNA
jgi:signal transduction histidine kinase